MSSSSDHTDAELLALAGALAGGVAQQLSRPIRELRETLAVIVDSLDQHVATAKGPTPYSWKQVGELRDRLADAYLVCRNVARLAGDLAAVAGTGSSQATAVDVNKTIEAALNLARHRVADETELFIDFGAIPTVRAVPAPLLLAVAQVIVQAADAIADAAVGQIALRSRRDDESVSIRVTDDGTADAGALERRIADVQRAATAAGVEVSGSLRDDGGTEICLRIPVRR